MNTKHILLFLLGYLPTSVMALTLAQSPLSINQGGTPLIMLNMERDHKLYYEAYNDASDLNKDSVLDTHYRPSIDYFGYFDSHVCYSYGSGKFTPIEKTDNLNKANKTCNTSSAWSGDFLNYLTMSRMDALRGVLYGGKRSTDTATATVLERSYIPQDAHSWGKEYTSTDVDGYDIALYTPLAQPVTGRRHLFANTSLLCPTGNTDPGCPANKDLPLLRVLNDTPFRVWEWLSIERPVAGVQCATGNNTRSNCAQTTASAFSSWGIVPAANFTDLMQTNYNTTGFGDYPDNTAEFNNLENNYANGGRRYGPSGGISAANINGSGNPNSTANGSQDNYMTIFTGTLNIPSGQGGTYKFGIDGDDAVDLFIDGNFIVGWYGGHGNCNGCLDSHSATVNLTAGNHTIKFRHQELAGGDNYYLNWQSPTIGNSMTDYVVRVDACVASFRGNDCRGYPRNNPTVYKPSGILQQFGESNRMAFGLMTGSYTKNESGGVLRKNISSITDEITSSTGVFSGTNGIIKTIDALKIVGFGNSYSYDQNCGVPEVGGVLTEGRCRMWGNPTAEIMYEGLRYFAGKTAGTTSFTYSGTTDDNTLGLPLPTWQDPYRSAATGGYPSCSKPSQLVISDINPNFDTDQLPGRYPYTVLPPQAFTGDLTGLDVSTLADTIWNAEYGSSKSLFIGQSGTNYDGAPTAKTATSFASIRGLSPEEPTQRGGYYSASVGMFGKNNDLNAAIGVQKVDNFSVALASPLPRIQFPLNGKNVTLVPFAKTVGGCGGVSAAPGTYQPTNTIVDFYVDTIVNTNLGNTITDTSSPDYHGGLPYAKFRINYEDSEYGSDHDMDAIAEYELTAKANGTFDVRTSSNYAAGGCIQHMGYVISGTSADGIYLEIRDPDTTTDVDYGLDTPNTNQPLPTDTTRNFSIATTVGASAAFVEHDPLWYAAKWGGFVDENNNDVFDFGDSKEWDSRNGVDGIPDSYFLVTNASELKAQLDRAFTEILARDGSSSAAATNSSSLDDRTRIYQAKFNSLDWSGQLLSFKFDTSGKLIDDPLWDSGILINAQSLVAGRVIITKDLADGVAFNYASLAGPTTTAGTQKNLLDKNAAGVTDNCGPERVAYLRGENTNEDSNGTFTCASGSVVSNFRERNTSKLADITDSNPAVVGLPSAGFSEAQAPGYSAFRKANSTRNPVVYVGANDGMLHGFDASIDFAPPNDKNGGINTASSGKEVLAYIPTAVIPNLSKLTDQTYNQNHLFFVDASPMTADVDLDSSASNNWRTVLIGAMGAGGKGYFALDVTNSVNFTEANAANIVLWEFNETDMGFSYNQPPIDIARGQALQIVKLKINGAEKWAAIVGNGYNSVAGKSVLYVVFIEDGIDGTWTAGDYVKLVADAPTGLDNGLSTPVPMDTNSDGFVDTVYAGDLKGNLWKFLIGENDSVASVTDSSSSWKVAFSSTNCGNTTPSTCVPLFKAINSANQVQSIMWPPVMSFHPEGGQLVSFGTGKFIENADISNSEIQSFYGIWDKNDGTTTVGTRAADLLQQTISATACSSPPVAGVVCTSGNFRIPSAKPITWRPNSPATFALANCTPTASCNPTHLGWYMDFNTTSKERVTGIPKLDSGVVVLNTLVPPDATCAPADGWLMVLDELSGSIVKDPVFDGNGNGTIDASDFLSGGFRVGGAIGGTTLIKSDSDSGNRIGVSSIANGKVEDTKLNVPKGLKGRVSWREIRQ